MPEGCTAFFLQTNVFSKKHFFSPTFFFFFQKNMTISPTTDYPPGKQQNKKNISFFRCSSWLGSFYQYIWTRFASLKKILWLNFQPRENKFHSTKKQMTFNMSWRRENKFLQKLYSKPQEKNFFKRESLFDKINEKLKESYQRKDFALVLFNKEFSEVGKNKKNTFSLPVMTKNNRTM